MAYTTIDDPEAYFQVQLYTGDGSADHAITLGADTDMQPDFVWIKNRDQTDEHCVFDAVRGATKVLHPDGDGAEATDADTLDSFTSDGFQVDADVKVNTNTEKYVAWNWKANGSGSSNTDGSINTTKTSANTTSGFSINTFTGTGSAATIGHGLGVVPKMIIVKTRGQASTWSVYHASLGETKLLRLEGTNAVGTETGWWNDTAPTSTLFTIGGNHYANTQVAYCFADVQGFSKFGGYTGNGNADGPFIYTGFKPAWVMVKRRDSAGGWTILDNKRDPFNEMDTILIAETTNVEVDFGTTNRNVDFVSNGFKIQYTAAGGTTELNASGGTYLYMAFAEAPFVNSKGVPCNAR